MNGNDLPFVVREGVRKDRDIVIYALSTCGFCKRAMEFLDTQGFAYRYLYVDQIPIERKTQIKAELKDKFNDSVAFPFAVFDGVEHLVGFIKPDWLRTLGLPPEAR